LKRRLSAFGVLPLWLCTPCYFRFNDKKLTMKIYTQLVLALATSLTAVAALSHVVLDDTIAAAGAAYRAVLRVGHGCEGAATNSLSVTIPTGFVAAQPLVKSGWNITTKVGKLAEPYEMHGTKITESVQEITWTAKGAENALPNALADEFVFRVTTPKKPGTAWFKVIQGCEKGSLEWVEIPATGQSAHGLKSPAARLEILDVQAAGDHSH
jgi:uncharacterized protein YcnI